MKKFLFFINLPKNNIVVRRNATKATVEVLSLGPGEKAILGSDTKIRF